MNSLVGFRFKPTDDEIIRLLKKKRLDPDFSVHTITEIKFYNFEPWELPGFCVIQSQEEVWYFYCEPYYKYAKSKRAHRRTKMGYWKVTGKGSKMKAKKSREEIGTKKILTFCCSKNPNTEWVMHEIAVEDDPLYKKNFVICRLERKRDTKLGMSASDEYQSSSELASCSTIDVSENVFMESVIPLDQPVDSHRSPVAENTDNSISHSRNGESTSLESILPPNQHLVSDRNHVAETRQLAESNPSEESSYSSGSYDDWDSMNPEFYNERIDDLISSLRALLDESSHEEPGQTVTPDFKSSKTDEISGEATGQTLSPDFNWAKWNRSDMDTETFCEWTKSVFEIEQLHSLCM